MRKSYILIVVSCCLLWFGQSAPADDKTTDQSQDEARKQLREQAILEAEKTAARNLMEQFISRAKQTSDLLAQFQSKAEALLPRLQRMLSDDAGKRLALDDTAFLNFIRLQEQPPADLEQIKSKKAAIDTMVTKLKEQLGAAALGYVPPLTMHDEVETSRQWALDGIGRVSESTNWLDAVIEKSPKDTDLAKAPTLKQRIAAYNTAKVESLARSRISGEQAAQAEGQQKVQEAARLAELMRAQGEADRLMREMRAQVERMRTEHEMEIKRMQDEQQQQVDSLNKQLADAQASRLRQEAQNQVTVSKAEQDATMTKKRQQARDPHVQAVLAPFIGKGYLQPKTGRGINAVPVSLSELRSIGALDVDQKGLDTLVKFANNPRNDRPHWGSYRDLRIPAEQMEKVKEAQGLLIDLGDALVAERLLAK